VQLKNNSYACFVCTVHWRSNFQCRENSLHWKDNKEHICATALHCIPYLTFIDFCIEDTWDFVSLQWMLCVISTMQRNKCTAYTVYYSSILQRYYVQCNATSTYVILTEWVRLVCIAMQCIFFYSSMHNVRLCVQCNVTAHTVCCLYIAQRTKLVLVCNTYICSSSVHKRLKLELEQRY